MQIADGFGSGQQTACPGPCPRGLPMGKLKGIVVVHVSMIPCVVPCPLRHWTAVAAERRTYLTSAP
jgi:hypothetical protein